MSDAAIPPPVLPPSRRRRALFGMAAVVALGALGVGAWWWLEWRHVEATDNAYVHAPLVQITPRVDGTVVEVAVDDTDAVRAGELLVRLDDADARLALQRTGAALAQAVREVRVLQAQDGGFDAQVQARRAEVERARAELARADDDLARRAPLKATGAVSDEAIQHAQATRDAARSALAAVRAAQAAAERQAAANRALSDGTQTDDHPAVQRAAAALREAFLALRRTELRAPVAGQVARRTVQVGQRVAAGAPLMAVIPLDQVWVEANFKEAQLRRMQVGQPVRLTADAYGRGVEYRGRIAGFGAGTGSAFALLPAQNATGNWIKIVQRVPVRIALERPLPEGFPLRVGLSMHAAVRLDEAAEGPAAAASGPAPATATAGAAAPSAADAARPAPATATATAGAATPSAADAAEAREADALVRRIIDAHRAPRGRP